MLCQKCGSNIQDGLYICPNCGSLVNSTSEQPTPEYVGYVKNYLVESILVIIFCCVPFGVVALVYACHVNTFLEMREFDRAKYASEKAKMWVWLGFVCGFIGIVLYALLLSAKGKFGA